MDDFKGRENMLKGVATAVSLVTVGLTGGSYFRTDGGDQFALVMTIFAFIYSLSLVILIVLKKMPTTTQFFKMEAIAYLVFVVLLAIAAIIFLVLTCRLPKYFGNSYLATRIFAMIFQFATAAIFAWILYEIYKKIKK
ncbi:uncharacterized protein LOC119077970 [Bradysia coprophila]|uniref:uncharacterized protein LOC119077970 n=1 Tax=Bradysia coprophila TaxID=38358 RepID=UPI00187DD253|nr:uncharacterized protein LOC119077970 [Bradysia coprophila]